MGAAVSTNVSKIVTDAIGNASNTILFSQDVSNNSSIIIQVSDTDGDVVIKDNVFEQRATINLRALQASLNSNEASQLLNQEIAQAAKSLVSGLNFLQFSNTSNTIDTLIKTCIDIKNTVTQTCLASSSQEIKIIVERTKGNVSITNIKTRQLSTLISDCVQKATSSNTILQDIESKFKQAATSTSEGINITALALLLIVGFVVVGGGVTAGPMAMTKIIFPLMLLGSLGSGVLYFMWTNSTVSSYGFADKLISENPDCAATATAQTTVKATSARIASEMCQNDDTCKAYEWFGGQAVLYNGPINNVCKSSYTTANKDTNKVIYDAVFGKGVGNPGSSSSNAWLNTVDSSLWIRETTGWRRAGAFPRVSDSSHIDWGDGNPPTAGGNGDIFINHKDMILYIFDGVWRKQSCAGDNSVTCQLFRSLPMGNIVSNADQSKTVGFKIITKKQYLLYVAIGLFAIGLVGLIVTRPRAPK